MLLAEGKEFRVSIKESGSICLKFLCGVFSDKQELGASRHVRWRGVTLGCELVETQS